MGLILKIAWRNILRHTGKSIIIGVILFLGALIMTFGNGVICGMEKGIEKNIINGFTGDIVIISDKQESDNVLFTIMGKAIEPIYNFLDIKKVLKQQEYVEKFLPAGRNMALILNEEGGAPGFAFLIGIDFDQYQKMFPKSMTCIEGRLAAEDERGALIPTGARKQFYDYTNLWFIPNGEKLNEENFKKETKEKLDLKNLKLKNSIVFLGYNEKNTTMDVRVNVKGIVKFKALNTILGHFNIIDIESYRECQGYFSAASKTMAIPLENQNLLDIENENIDELFNQGSIFTAESNKEIKEDPKRQKHIRTKDEPVPKIEENFFTGEASPKKIVDEDKAINKEAGAYNVVFVKLKEGISLNEGLNKINKALLEKNLEARAVTWKKAFGLIGSMATIIKGALFGFVMLLFIVAVIIIINTLTMAALGRVSEIGMMRAIGAKRSFIGSMFFGETAILSFVFGGMGILFGIIAVHIVPLFNITSSNDMVQLLFGGDTFFPILPFPYIIITILQLFLVTLIAVIYPIKVAKNITPLDAIVRD